jgi:hypothetical protein
VGALQRWVAPGGLLVVKDLDPDTPEGVYFALTMALYTAGGRVHAGEAIARWTGGVVERAGKSLVVIAVR